MDCDGGEERVDPYRLIPLDTARWDFLARAAEEASAPADICLAAQEGERAAAACCARLASAPGSEVVDRWPIAITIQSHRAIAKQTPGWLRCHCFKS